eukprot:m.92128 g.92128  ORF g.92128 m.92128 type:complete len:141 (+) comp12349_c1_seq1:27-449(+)
MAVMDKTHPKYPQLVRYEKYSQRAAIVAYLCCIDLEEAKNYLDVTVHHCDELNLVYFSAREGTNQPLEVVVPVAVEDTHTIGRLFSYFDVLVDPSTGVGPNRFIVAIIDDDSTNVHYRLKRGIVPPTEKDIDAIDGEDED